MSLTRLILSFKGLVIFGEEHIKSCTVYLFPYLLFLSSPLSCIYITHCPWLSNSLNVVPYLRVRDQVSPTYKTTVYSLLVCARLWVIVLQLLLN
jgi:hypothetical protein